MRQLEMMVGMRGEVEEGVLDHLVVKIKIVMVIPIVQLMVQMCVWQVLSKYEIAALMLEHVHLDCGVSMT